MRKVGDVINVGCKLSKKMSTKAVGGRKDEQIKRRGESTGS